MKKNPFIAGNWVRGENFFGRQNLINEILEGRRNYLWIAGTRRFGKTSFLKQIELLTLDSKYADEYISLFWDLQGSHDLEGLKESLLESLEDAESRFTKINVDIDELEDKELFGILRELKRRAKDAQLKLMLLCDEAEELINIEKNNPEVLPKLRRFFQRGDNIYTILTATKRLSVLEHTSTSNTSPFLYGFVPPIYLTRLEQDEAIRLIGQWNFDDADTQQIMAKTNNHPYLIQLICRRLIETGDFAKVMDEISHDEMISHFFSVDFQYLQPAEKEILLHLLPGNGLTLEELQSAIGLPQEKLVTMMYGLTQLGTVKQANGGYAISNFFFEKWLQREKDRLYSESDLKKAEHSIRISEMRPQAHLTPRIGARLAQHEILDKLGSGGMGMVFKARDRQLDRIVAIKVLHPQLLSDPAFKERFILEAQAASAMNHPNIATIYQIGDEGGNHYISMEYVEGLPLKQWRTENADNLVGQIDIAIQSGKALAHAHKRGVIHRDVKSENILVTADNLVKVMDFGLAKTRRKADKLTRTGTTLGTLAYMSPEQASGLETDHRTDIFSFGVVLYELFAGTLPFEGEYELSILYAIMNEDPPPLQKCNPNLPAALEIIVGKALKKDREQRYQTMEEMVNTLVELAETQKTR